MPDLNLSVKKPVRRLSEIQFGFASADYEAAHNPELLLSGFTDPFELVKEARHGHKFLFLGYKGSGKSALGEHLRLLTNAALFVNFVNIADVSFSTFSKILKGNVEPEARYPVVWSWLLLIFLLDSFSNDEGSNYAHSDDIFLSVEALTTVGLLPGRKLSELVNMTADQSFSLKLSTVLGSLESTIKSTRVPSDFPFLVSHLKQITGCFRSDSTHLLVIDGFDELLRRGNLQYDALGSLIFEANQLNMELTKASVNAKIIILCRTDLFERLPGPNKNKIRQTAAMHIDWYSRSEKPSESPLLTLIERRAILSAGYKIDIFADFLPSSLKFDGRGMIKTQLLEYTRHVPRDIVMLFSKLKEYSAYGQMTHNQVLSALVAYSKDYLLPEILDELDGYIENEQRDQFIRLVGSLRKRKVSFSELKQKARDFGYGSSFDLPGILNVLFECSAIGNLSMSSNRQSAIFKYKNRHASYNQAEPILMHQGLWFGLDLNF